MNYEYKTKDFYLACYLKAAGLKLLRVDKKSSIAFFYFKSSSDLKNIITGFYNSEDKVSANNLVNSIKDLKALIYNL